MTERLRALSRPLRYLIYAAGALLVFFTAVGMGATAAVVVGWQTGGAGSGSAESSMLEGGRLETTGATQASEGTAIGPSGDRNSGDRGNKVSFVHRATDENSRGDFTVISHRRIDGHPDAVVLASPASDRGNSGATSYEHNIGVWYVPTARRWAIFNQDRTPVPAGTTFEVEIPSPSASFVHEARLLNTAGNYTYLDNRLTNGQPDAVLSVTQNWNPGGGRGVYNDHPVATIYDAKVEKWAIYNRDGASIREGAAFNVAVSARASASAR